MMRHLLLSAALLALPVHAQSIAQRIDHMVKECEAVMIPGSEVCRVFLDKRDFGAQTTIPTAYGRISVDSYLKFRNSGEQMCKLIPQVCTEETFYTNHDCVAAKIMWRQK